MWAKVQVNYSSLILRDRFILKCAAYEQPIYKVDKQLNVIEEVNNDNK